MRVALVGVLLLSSGCVPLLIGAMGKGTSETQLDRNVWVVRSSGNAYTSYEEVLDMALLRSAELALSGGFRYFVIVESGDTTRSATWVTPRESRTTATVSGYGNTAYVDGQTRTYGGHAYTMTKPGRVNTIVCYVERPEFPGMVYDAAFLEESLTKKYWPEKTGAEEAEAAP